MTGPTVAIIQARMGSTRLPGKTLLPLLGEPMLTRVVRRVQRATTVDAVVVATTRRPADDVLVELAATEAWPIVRGSERDLLSRYLDAARLHEAGTIVRITSDCPLIDPGLIDDVVRGFRAADVDYASNTLPPRTYPRGLDVEVLTREALEIAGREDTDPAWREHATPFLYRHPERFRLLRVPSDEERSDVRWSVDTLADFEVARRIYEALGRDDFSWREALAVSDAEVLESLNRHVEQKAVPPAGSGG